MHRLNSLELFQELHGLGCLLRAEARRIKRPITVLLNASPVPTPLNRLLTLYEEV